MSSPRSSPSHKFFGSFLSSSSSSPSTQRKQNKSSKADPIDLRDFSSSEFQLASTCGSPKRTAALKLATDSPVILRRRALEYAKSQSFRVAPQNVAFDTAEENMEIAESTTLDMTLTV